jgi:phage terminase large subunit
MDAKTKIEVPDEYIPLWESDKFFNLITGGRGSTKSFNVAFFLLMLTFEKGHKILFTRYTMTSAEKSIIPEFLDKIEREQIQEFFIITKDKIINSLTGSEIMFAGVKTSSGNQTANLKSIEGITTFIMDEAEEWVDEEAFDKLVLTVRKVGIQNRVVIVMNPCNRQHFIYKKFIENTHKIVDYYGYPVEVSIDPRVCHIHTTYHNFKHYLNKDFLENIEYLESNDTLDFGYAVIGQWRTNAAGLMYSNLMLEDFRITPEYVRDNNLITLSMTDLKDMGTDTLASVVVAIGLDNRAYIVDIIYNTDDMRKNLPNLILMLNKWRCVRNVFESNFQGMNIATNIEPHLPQGSVKSVASTMNKVKKIQGVRTVVTQLIFAKNAPHEEYAKAINHIQNFPYDCKASDDGIEDALSMMAMHLYTNYSYVFQRGTMILN